MGTDATEAPHPEAEGASLDVVPLEGVPLIGVGIAGAKTVAALICPDQVGRDHPSGIGNFVRLLTDGRDHLPTTTVIEILDIGLALGLYLGTLHELWHRRHLHIPHSLEGTRACTQTDLSSLS